MGLYAADGSINVALDTGDPAEYDTEHGGLYSPSGAIRINTTDAGPGLYAEDGAYRGSVSDDEGTPAAGVGRFTPDGALRLTSGGARFANPGIYAQDGGLRVTVVN